MKISTALDFRSTPFDCAQGSIYSNECIEYVAEVYTGCRSKIMKISTALDLRSTPFDCAQGSIYSNECIEYVAEVYIRS